MDAWACKEKLVGGARRWGWVLGAPAGSSNFLRSAIAMNFAEELSISTQILVDPELHASTHRPEPRLAGSASVAAHHGLAWPAEQAC